MVVVGDVVRGRVVKKALNRGAKRQPPTSVRKSPSSRGDASAPRVRRTRDEARALILDAAEKRLEEGGPDGIRLQEIAADVGVSHPTILHHFGSREALVDAVVMRALAGIQEEAAASLGSEGFAEADATALLTRIMKALSERGHARVLAWLALTGNAQDDPNHLLRAVAQTLHARRTAETGCEAPFEDSLFVVALSSLVLFGEGIFGQGTWNSAGLASDQGVSDRFHAWLVTVLRGHMHASAANTLAGSPGPVAKGRKPKDRPKRAV